MKIIKIGDKDYPKKLQNIFNPPKKLYILGNEKILNNFSIAMVGARYCSKYGENTAKCIAYNLAKYNVNVISGMARGIDTASHKGTILGKGKTIAILGSGFNHIYPKENIQLLEDIIRNGGAIITEYSENTYPEPQNFPERNRIISGLSDGVVVVEAAKRSGSLITAELALEQGRDVFAVPGNVSSYLSQGTNELIKEGAKLTTNVKDILEEYTLNNFKIK